METRRQELSVLWQDQIGHGQMRQRTTETHNRQQGPWPNAGPSGTHRRFCEKPSTRAESLSITQLKAARCMQDVKN